MKEEIIRLGANGRRSTCLVHGGLMYTSGITTVDLKADMKTQANDIFSQLEKLMSLNGTNKHNILSATIYLGSIEEIGDFNAAWDEWIDDTFEPARSVVEAKLELKDYRVKISIIAAIP